MVTEEQQMNHLDAVLNPYTRIGAQRTAMMTRPQHLSHGQGLQTPSVQPPIIIPRPLIVKVAKFSGAA
jgi:hypothetical protein